MIDLKRFSLAKSKVTIERYSGSYVGGIYQRAVSETIQTWASVQPYNTVDPSNQFQPTNGSWPEEKYIMYIDQVVYADDPDNPNQTADKITADGVAYEPIRVQKWLHLNNEHYKVILQKWDGD